VEYLFFFIPPLVRSGDIVANKTLTFLVRTGCCIATYLVHLLCLQCFDAVGWVSGRASGL